jgi:hypothetical protein
MKDLELGIGYWMLETGGQRPPTFGGGRQKAKGKRLRQKTKEKRQKIKNRQTVKRIWHWAFI